MDQYAQQSEYGQENYDYEQGQPQQRAPPSKYQVRPQVDPDAEGDVDPNL